jgi:DNA-binding response OmpR family regulator
MPHPPDHGNGAGFVHSHGPIFIVDDDPECAATLRTTIASWELPNEITIFGDGKQLVDLLDKTTEGFGSISYPSLIILDLKLPGISGVQVMQWLKDAGHTEVPVIIVSGSQNFGAIAETYELGAYCFISKPQRPGDLEKIKHALRIW